MSAALTDQRQTMNYSRVLALFALPLAVTACFEPGQVLLSPDGGDAVAAACGGSRPALDECVTGALWAECGETTARDPVFSCRRSDGRCYWFADGCVALGFESSTCPAADLCCIGEPLGYPFDASWQNPDAPSASVYDALKGWGVTPWNRTRDRDVVVVEGPIASGEPSLVCTGELGPPCADSGSTLNVQRTLRGALTLKVNTTRPNLGGWSLSVEVIPDDDATLHARVCIIPFTDSVTFSCGPIGPTCATSGSVELAAFPTDAAAASTTRLHVAASFADGTTIDAQL